MPKEQSRRAEIKRKTSETDIHLVLDLDQAIEGKIATGSAFLDHMLDLFRKHGGFGLQAICKGDAEVDMHHSTEDLGICLGQALVKSIGNKAGIERYGFYYVPMDEALARCVVDLSGRYGFAFNAKFNQKHIGNWDTELAEHFFTSVAENAHMNLHIDLIRGENTHHCLEAIFKAFARAMSMAISPSRRTHGIPSTKGMLA